MTDDVIDQRPLVKRSADALPEDQRLLGLEEAEQIEAAGMEDAEQHSPAERLARTAKRWANRGALPPHLPRVEMVVDIEDQARAAETACIGSAKT